MGGKAQKGLVILDQQDDRLGRLVVSRRLGGFHLTLPLFARILLGTLPAKINFAGGGCGFCGCAFSVDQAVPACYALPMFGTVLLVEDEDQVMRLMAKVLEMHGYAVLAAESGAQALEMSAAHPGNIDLL